MMVGASWITHAIIAVAKLLGGLFAVVIAILIGFRVAAEFREGGAAKPAGMVTFSASGAPVAATVSGPADGPRILLVHGSAGWSGFWSEVSGHLARRGWRVIAVDLPPYGWSGRDPEQRYDRIAQSKRLAAVLAALGPEPSVVVAHSFGAGAATELALRHPERLAQLILVDAALGELDKLDDGAAAKALKFGPLAELVTAATVTNPLATGPLIRPMLARKDSADAWIGVLQAPMRRDGTTAAYAAWLPSLFESADGALSRRSAGLRAIRVPVTLIWGGADTVTPIDQGRRIAALTRSRSLTVLPGVGHIPHIEDPPAFLAALDAALAAEAGQIIARQPPAGTPR